MLTRLPAGSILRLTGRAGFSIPETLMAMAVLGITIVALVNGMTWGIKDTSLARDNEFATQILTERMETIRLYSMTEVTNQTFLPASETITDPKNANRTYTLTYAVTNNFLAANYATNLAQVTFSLSWTNAGLARQRTQRTYVSNSGLKNYVN